MSTTVSIYFDKKRKSKNGFPLKLRLTNNRKSDYISLKLYLSEDSYNDYQTKKRLSEDLKLIKRSIIKSEARANEILSKMDSYSFQEFKVVFLGKKLKIINKDSSINSLFDKRIEEFKALGKLKSANTYQCTIRAINRFKSNIMIDKIDSKFLHSFHSYLLDDDKSITTVSIYMRNLRAIINANRNLINNYPFSKYKVPSPANNKRAITETDLQRILSYQFTSSKDNFFLDLYKFSYYAAGANTIDICKLKPKNIQGEYLIYNRSKTNKQIKVFILPKAKEIIKKYSGGEYLFPLITNEEPQYLYDRSHSVVKSINKRLKRLCEDLKLPKITTYSSRHSFSTVLMNKGASIAFISQSLGHTSISTTQSYLGSFTDSQMEENMKKLI